MPVPLERQHTVEEYFSVEESSTVKHEYYQGQILAMAGASLRHNRLVGNVFSALRVVLAGSACEVFASDLRVLTPGGLYTYPDVMVVCGGVALSPGDRLDTVTNPSAIVEVLSRSTAAYDRGEKYRLYQAVPTLREYLLVDQDTRLVSLHTRPAQDRPASEWPRADFSEPTSHVTLPSLGVSLSLAAIYAGVNPEAGQSS
jgi:Uma2 family endonuclease